MEIINKTAVELAAEIKSGQTKAVDVLAAFKKQIDAKEDSIGAFVTLNFENAQKKAQEVDQKVANGEEVGALAGIPVAVKDNIHIEGIPTSCASKALEKFTPPYTAHVAQKLIDADAIIIGKTNLDEFAMGSSTENSAIKPTKNPWNTDCVPGGSSGGSAAAIAAGFAPLALGSDTGGSIRAPASFCGCVGLKPTYGTVSRYGLVAFGSSLDQIGPFAKNVEDAALLLSVISGEDKRDATSAKITDDFCDLPENALVGKTVGLPKEYFETEGLDPEVKQQVENAIETLKNAGATIKEISLSTLEFAGPTYYIIATAEASSNLGRYDGAHYSHRAQDCEDIIQLFSRSREASFGEEVKRRIMLGTYVLSAGYYDAYYLRALKVRTLIANDFEKAFKEVDIIASPVAPSTAFKLGEKLDDPLSMYLSDIYTISANLAALPGISVPCGFSSSGLPVGLQLLCARGDDQKLLQIAAAYDKLSPASKRIADA